MFMFARQQAVRVALRSASSTVRHGGTRSAATKVVAGNASTVNQAPLPDLKVNVKSPPAPAQPVEVEKSAQDHLDDIRAALRSDSETTLDLSLRYINTIPSSSSKSPSPTTLQSYTDLFDAYLSHGTPQSLKSLSILIERLDDKSLYSHEIILKTARLALSSPDTHLPILLLILPMRKVNADTPLIARIAHELARRKLPSDQIAALIYESVELDPESVRTWPGYLWQRLMSFCDAKTALQLLERYKELAGPFIDSIPRPLTLARTQSISKPFAAALRQWTIAARSKRLDPTTPSRIAQDLASYIGDENYPTMFLNEWLNAERIAKNYHSIYPIWQRFDTTSNMYQPSKHAKPDSQSWIIYFKAQKAAERRNTRKELHAMFNTIHPSDISTKLLNSALSSLVTEGEAGICPDLPALMLLLSKYDYDPEQNFGPAPDARTIDIAAAGLIRIWRAEGAYLDRLFVPSIARQVREHTKKWRRGTPARYGLHPSEWRLIGKALEEITAVKPNRSYRTRVPLAGLLPLSEKNVDGQARTAGKEERVAPAMLLLPMMELVERAIKLFLADKVDSDVQLEKAYKSLWKRVEDDVLGKDGEALTHYIVK